MEVPPKSGPSKIQTFLTFWVGQMKFLLSKYKEKTKFDKI